MLVLPMCIGLLKWQTSWIFAAVDCKLNRKVWAAVPVLLLALVWTINFTLAWGAIGLLLYILPLSDLH
eukprot:6014285-Amphidinium_carterae.1